MEGGGVTHGEVQGRTLSPTSRALPLVALAAPLRDILWTNLPKAVVLRGNALERIRRAEQL